MSKKPSRSRRRRFVGLGTLFVVLAVLLWWLPPVLVRRWITRSLPERLGPGGRVGVGSVRLRLLSGKLELVDLEVQGASPRPWSLAAAKVRVVLSWSDLVAVRVKEAAFAYRGEGVEVEGTVSGRWRRSDAIARCEVAGLAVRRVTDVAGRPVAAPRGSLEEDLARAAPFSVERAAVEFPLGAPSLDLAGERFVRALLDAVARKSS